MRVFYYLKARDYTLKGMNTSTDLFYLNVLGL